MSRKMIFFGAGEVCRHSISHTGAESTQIECIVDNNPQKWETLFYGIPVISPNSLYEKMAQNQYEIVITVGPQASGAIDEQLQSMGFSYGTDYITFYDKFFSGTIPVAIHHGGYYEGEGDFIPLKPISDQVLLTDAARTKVYRAVLPGQEIGLRQIYEKIEEDAELSKCVVKTEICNDEILNKEYPLVFQHEYLPFISYPSEWSPLMFRDYVIFIIDFIKKLDVAGLGLRDPNVLNTIFHNGKFLYIDYSGIWWNKTNWYIMRTWFDLHINTLFLIKKNQAKGYLYLHNPSMVAKYADIEGYMDDEEKQRYQAVLSRCKDLTNEGKIAEVCNLLTAYVKEITSDFRSFSDWTGYQDNLYNRQHDEENYTRKQKEVLSLVRSVKPGSVMDLAGNMGWYSIALSDEVDYATTLDIDSGISDCAYEMIKQKGVKNVYPLYANAMQPKTGGFIQRVKCDMVLALAVIHHLALTQGLTFEQILYKMSLYTNRFLLIEFVMPEDPYSIQYLRQFEDDRTTWYTKERFEKALNKMYRIIEQRPSEVPTRRLYLCERR